ncbi:hypothetical protein AB0M43_37640 [Longispora sp. NPDC051575]|uniref:hypothetical protein n=1 Tax=Longispora sp. NPDC051575 TaxID=3154943 RepID=UPI00343F742E
MLGVDADEAGEIVAAVLAERAPRDVVGYLRHLVRNGDIAKWRLSPVSPVAAAGPTHGYLDPADDGYCHHPGCGLPPQSPRHAPTDHGRN